MTSNVEKDKCKFIVSVCESVYYRLIVFFVVMPTIGAMIERGYIITGMVLMLMQVLWVFSWAKK
jgi:hypothetical protein